MWWGERKEWEEKGRGVKKSSEITGRKGVSLLLFGRLFKYFT